MLKFLNTEVNSLPQEILKKNLGTGIFAFGAVVRWDILVCDTLKTLFDSQCEGEKLKKREKRRNKWMITGVLHEYE